MGIDILIKKGTIVDGTGKAVFGGDIAIHQGRIVQIGPGLEGKADLTIEADEKIVAPGFIDIHTHADEKIKQVSTADNYLLQGVTTVIGGNCGRLKGGEDIRHHLNEIEKTRISPNYGVLVGHGDIRTQAMENATRVAQEKEKKEMVSLITKGLREGAFGVSLGLEYWPGRYASTEELVEVAKAANEEGGFLAGHIRDEQAGVITSVGEAIEVARKAEIPVLISHLKACGSSVWGSGKTLISMLTMAQALGIEVTADQYPYRASSTGLSQCFPDWSLENEVDGLEELLEEPSQRRRIRSYAKSQIELRVGDDLSLVQIAAYEGEPDWSGRTFEDVLKMRGLEANLENAVDLVIEMFLYQDPTIIYHYILDEDLETILRSPFAMLVSDGYICEYEKDSPHPRSYGSFPRVLGRYVREKSLISVEKAIQKMTSMPAARLGLHDRGRIAVGAWADIVVFDMDTIMDKSTFSNPHQYPKGVHAVMVNGVLTAKDGKHLGQKAGKVLYKKR